VLIGPPVELIYPKLNGTHTRLNGTPNAVAPQALNERSPGCAQLLPPQLVPFPPTELKQQGGWWPWFLDSEEPGTHDDAPKAPRRHWDKVKFKYTGASAPTPVPPPSSAEMQEVGRKLHLLLGWCVAWLPRDRPTARQVHVVARALHDRLQGLMEAERAAAGGAPSP
jgi:hypothetical protein